MQIIITIRMNIKESFDIYFDLVENPRSQAHIKYKLSDILFLLIVGMFCNCTDLESIPCLSTISNILKIFNPYHLELRLYGIFSNVLTCSISAYNIAAPKGAGFSLRSSLNAFTTVANP